jgi:hypothetical protein
MSIFDGMCVRPNCWRPESERMLTNEEKQLTKCAIVIKSRYGYSLELFTNIGIKQIPIIGYLKPSIGQVVNVDNIKVITLVNPYEQLPIYRVEF